MKIANVKEFLSFLKRIPAKAINMSSYIEPPAGIPMLAANYVVEHEASCGTTACIAGWCSLYVHRNDPVAICDLVSKILSVDGYTGGWPNIVAKEEARKFMGLTPRQADKLFITGPWGSRPGQDSTTANIGHGLSAKRKILKQLRYMVATGKV